MQRNKTWADQDLPLSAAHRLANPRFFTILPSMAIEQQLFLRNLNPRSSSLSHPVECLSGKVVDNSFKANCICSLTLAGLFELYCKLQTIRFVGQTSSSRTLYQGTCDRTCKHWPIWLRLPYCCLSSSYTSSTMAANNDTSPPESQPESRKMQKRCVMCKSEVDKKSLMSTFSDCLGAE